MSSCHMYEHGIDTAGNPIYHVKCFCGTTACKRLNEFKLTTCEHQLYIDDDELPILEKCIKCGKIKIIKPNGDNR